MRSKQKRNLITSVPVDLYDEVSRISKELRINRTDLVVHALDYVCRCIDPLDKSSGLPRFLFKQEVMKTVRDDVSHTQCLDLKGVCDSLMLSKSTVTTMLQSGEVRGYKVKNQWRVRVQDLNDFIDSMEARELDSDTPSSQELPDDPPDISGKTIQEAVIHLVRWHPMIDHKNLAMFVYGSCGTRERQGIYSTVDRLKSKGVLRRVVNETGEEGAAYGKDRRTFRWELMEQ